MMNKPSKALRAVGYSLMIAMAALLCALFAGGVLFGFQFARWTEWQGRVVGVSVTLAAFVGAAVGLRTALRAQPRAVK